jgi:hypothetical protein
MLYFLMLPCYHGYGSAFGDDRPPSTDNRSEQALSEQTVNEQTVNEQTVNEQTVNEQTEGRTRGGGLLGSPRRRLLRELAVWLCRKGDRGTIPGPPLGASATCFGIEPRSGQRSPVVFHVSGTSWVSSRVASRVASARRTYPRTQPTKYSSRWASSMWGSLQRVLLGA